MGNLNRNPAAGSLTITGNAPIVPLGVSFGALGPAINPNLWGVNYSWNIVPASQFATWEAMYKTAIGCTSYTHPSGWAGENYLWATNTANAWAKWVPGTGVPGEAVAAFASAVAPGTVTSVLPMEDYILGVTNPATSAPWTLSDMVARIQGIFTGGWIGSVVGVILGNELFNYSGATVVATRQSYLAKYCALAAAVIPWIRTNYPSIKIYVGGQWVSQTNWVTGGAQAWGISTDFAQLQSQISALSAAAWAAIDGICIHNYAGTDTNFETWSLIAPTVASFQSITGKAVISTEWAATKDRTDQDSSHNYKWGIKNAQVMLRCADAMAKTSVQSASYWPDCYASVDSIAMCDAAFAVVSYNGQLMNWLANHIQGTYLNVNAAGLPAIAAVNSPTQTTLIFAGAQDGQLNVSLALGPYTNVTAATVLWDDQPNTNSVVYTARTATLPVTVSGGKATFSLNIGGTGRGPGWEIAILTLVQPLVLTPPSGALSITGVAPTVTVRDFGTLAWTDAADTIAAVGSGIASGALAWTEAADTVASAGTVQDRATLAWTEAPDAIVAAGTARDLGTLAWTDAADTIAVAGTAIPSNLAFTPSSGALSISGSAPTVTVRDFGTLAWTDAADTIAALGSGVTGGALAWTDALDTVALAGTVQDRAALAWTDAADTVASAGSVLDLGTLAWTDALDVISASGTAISSVVTGTLAWTDVADAIAIAGAGKVTGGLSWTEAADTLSVAGTVQDRAVGAWADPPDTISAAGTAAFITSGALAWTEASDTIAASGKTNNFTTLAWTEAADAIDVEGIIGSALQWTERADIIVMSAIGSSVGTLTILDPADTVAVAGSSHDFGVAAWTEPLDSISVAGRHALSVPLAWTETRDTIAISGAVGNNCSLAWTERPDTISAAGGNVLRAPMAWTDAADAVSISIYAAFNYAVGDWTDPPDTFRWSAGLTDHATLAWDEASDALSFSGVILPNTIPPTPPVEPPFQGIPQSHSVYDYQEAWTDLLPQGSAWPRERETVLQTVLLGLAGVWGSPDATSPLPQSQINVDDRSGTLLWKESDPRSTVEMLPDWEAAFGLPDLCLAEPLTISDRQRALVARIAMTGGQSRPWFYSYAKQIGYTIEIIEHAPYMCGVSHVGNTTDWLGEGAIGPRWECGNTSIRFYWTIAPAAVRLTWFKVGGGGGQCGVDHLLDIAEATDLECAMRRYHPCHTTLSFDYAGLEPFNKYSGTNSPMEALVEQGIAVGG